MDNTIGIIYHTKKGRKEIEMFNASIRKDRLLAKSYVWLNLKPPTSHHTSIKHRPSVKWNIEESHNRKKRKKRKYRPNFCRTHKPKLKLLVFVQQEGQQPYNYWKSTRQFCSTSSAYSIPCCRNQT